MKNFNFKKLQKDLRKSLSDTFTYKGYRIELNGYKNKVTVKDQFGNGIYQSHYRLGKVGRAPNLKFLTVICESINKAEAYLASDECDVIVSKDFLKMITNHIVEKVGPNTLIHDEDDVIHSFVKNSSTKEFELEDLFKIAS